MIDRDRFRSMLADHGLHLILVTFLLCTVIGAVYAPLQWDEGSFLHNAEVLAGEDRMIEENRPLALSAVIAAVWTVTGQSTVAGRMISILFGLAAIILFHQVARSHDLPALPMTAVFAFSPLFLYWSFHAYTDVAALVFVLGAWHVYTRDRYLFAGALIGVAATFRFVFAAFGLGILLAAIMERRGYGAYLFGSVVGATPFFIHSSLRYDAPFGKVFLYLERVSTWSGTGLFAATTANAVGAVHVLGGLIAVPVVAWRDTPWIERGLLLSYAGFILLVPGTSFTRYWLPVLPILLVGAGRSLSQRQLRIAVASMLLLSLFTVGGTVADEVRCSQPFEDAMQHLSGVNEPVVSERWAVAGYLLDTRVHAPWTDYVSLREDYGVRWVVTTEQADVPADAVFSNACVTYYVYDLYELI